ANKEFGEGKDSAERAKTIPHEKTFEQWDKEPRAGVASDAWDLLNASKGLDKANVWVSRLEWNKIGSEKISFNVKYGVEPNQIPLTLHFYKEGGRTMVAVSEGWNSKAILSNAKTFKRADNDDPVARMLEYGYQVNRLEYGQKPADFQAPEAVKSDAPAEGDKAKAPQKAPEKAPTKPSEVSVLRSTENKQIIDEKNKAFALDDICKQITDEKMRARVMTYIGFKIAGETPSVTVTEDKARQDYYKPIIWKYLAEMAGVKLAGAEANDAEKKTIVDTLNKPGAGEKLAKEIDNFLGGKFKETPRTAAALKAMVDRVKYDPNGKTDDDKAMVAYKAKLIETVETLLKKPENQKKADETEQKYDDRIRLLIKKFVKGPEEFVAEYKKVLAETKKPKEPAAPADKPKAPAVAKGPKSKLNKGKAPQVAKVPGKGGNAKGKA
ncbi:hypothetical protein IT411_03035, partial [Candidatus Peregrinibacteria bacterium]|nr:hypothetical protein [Candidatus Peregrinibacteria bacterium]